MKREVSKEKREKRRGYIERREKIGITMREEREDRREEIEKRRHRQKRRFRRFNTEETTVESRDGMQK
jgi:hypothetical protein